ncbi:hypothetical protein MKX03_017689 [Papaver bracteatum]|nr:hypothetical protein MKX03_017689 [Papaver bracteatum]
MESFRTWYMDGSDEDQRLPHHREPKEYVSFGRLNVLSWRLDRDNYETDVELKKIRAECGYTYVDFCDLCLKRMPNYEQKIKIFFEEHIHTDEEIRYCVDVSGYFDVRDQNKKWIHVWVKKGGMIVLSAGIYHRFTLDSDNYIKCGLRTTYNRPHDELLARKEYLDTFSIVQHAYLLYLSYFGIVQWELFTNRCHLRVCPNCRLLMLLHLR